MKKSLIALVFLLTANMLKAQEPINSEPNTKDKKEASFLLSGFGFTEVSKEDKSDEAMTYIGIHPIILWKKDRFFFEEELSLERMNGKTSLEVEFAVFHYKICKGLELGAGKFLSPFGIFSERIHPSWVNKFADNPLGFSHDAEFLAGPMTEFGFEAEGALQFGPSKVNYVVYATNGPSLVTNDPMMNGMLMFENIPDNNDNKALGGRIGFLPFSNSCFEIGLSQQIAKVGDKENETYRNVGASLSAIDLSINHKLNFIKSNFELKAQYNTINVDKTVYMVDTSMTGVDSNFTSNSTAYFIQASLRPSFVENDFLSRLELNWRYSHIELPETAAWANHVSQVTFGLNYWYSWRSVIKLNYQTNENEYNKEQSNKLFLQWGFGF